MKCYLDKDSVLRLIRSFLNDLRPESTGLICDIYEAVNHMESTTGNKYKCLHCSMAECVLPDGTPCSRKMKKEEVDE